MKNTTTKLFISCFLARAMYCSHLSTITDEKYHDQAVQFVFLPSLLQLHSAKTIFFCTLLQNTTSPSNYSLPSHRLGSFHPQHEHVKIRYHHTHFRTHFLFFFAAYHDDQYVRYQVKKQVHKLKSRGQSSDCRSI